MHKEKITIRNLLIASMLILAATSTLIEKHGSSRGIDFYNLWGVGYLLKEYPLENKNPYIQQRLFADLLFRKSQGTDNLQFSGAGKYWRTAEQRGEFVASPLLFTVFASFPSSYSTAFPVYNLLQALAFFLSFLAFGVILNKRQIVPLAGLSLILIWIPAPLQADLRVGNISTLQLFSLLVLTLYADRFFGPSSNRAETSLWSRVFFVVLIMVLLMLKLNLLIPLSLFLVYFVARHRGKPAFEAGVIGLLCSLAIAILPCYYFRSVEIWLDWYNFAFHSDPPRLVIPYIEGNMSIIAALRDYNISGIPLVAGPLGISLYIAFWVAYKRLGGGKAAIGQIVSRSFGHPYWVLTIGVAATAALSPIMWFHYYVIIYAPALWLLFGPGQSSFNQIMGASAIFLLSNSYLLVRHFVDPGILAEYWVGLTVMSSWLPLWFGGLAFVVGSGQSAPENDRSTAEKQA